MALTAARRGGGGGVAPVAPDASFLGAVDAIGVAPHLDEVDGARAEASQAAGGLVAHIIHHLQEEGEEEEMAALVCWSILCHH